MITEPWASLVVATVTVLLGVGAALLGGPLVSAVFRSVDGTQRRRALAEPAGQATTTSNRQLPILPAAPALPDEPGDVVAAGAHLRGGVWIGRLERVAVFATLLAGYPEGVAVALAVKGLARYPELRATHTGAAERFIIGTFVSVLLAAGAAGLAVAAGQLLR